LPRLRALGPALGERDFALLWLALLGMGVSVQMLEVAIGWQVYTNHRSALNLGLIGLAEFIPMFVLALPAGQLADRVSRRLVLGCALLGSAAVGAGLAAVSIAGVRALAPFLALALASGAAYAIGIPAARALPAALVPEELIESAMTLRSIATQTSMVLGPALGGLLYPLASGLVYCVAAVVCVLGSVCVSLVRHQPAADARAAAVVSADAGAGDEPGGANGAGPGSDDRRAPSLASVLAGVRFIAHTQILFGAILLDLLAVLFGGAVALLPLFARSILHVGPVGVGVLRSAPAVGALVAAAALTRRPLGGHAGRTLLGVVGAFGASIVVFGLSRSFVLSLLALAVSGFVDMYSMYIRSTTVALVTPDRLRGRVLAVEMVFISASNQLGAFESGLAAFLLGAVPAVVAGGALTIAIALGWGRLFPALAGIDRMRDLRPAPSALAVADALSGTEAA